MSKQSRKTEQTWETSQERFVGFIDILGFKESVLREEHEIIYGKLLKLSERLQYIEGYSGDNKFKDVEIKTYNFSDSIFIFSKSNSPEDFGLFTIAMMFIMSQAIQMEIPLKGAMAYGKMTINLDKKIFFGQPLIDAYLLEEDLKYFGVAVHHSVEKFITDNSTNQHIKDKVKFNYFETLTPFKSGKVRHFNLLWSAMTIVSEEATKKTKKEQKEIVLKFVEKFKLSSSGAPRIYLENTIDLLERYYK